MSGRDYLEKVLIVQGQNLARDILDARVDQVQAILPCVDVANDTVVHVDEGIFGFLN
jgi:hypothetical protein